MKHHLLKKKAHKASLYGLNETLCVSLKYLDDDYIIPPILSTTHC